MPHRAALAAALALLALPAGAHAADFAAPERVASFIRFDGVGNPRAGIDGNGNAVVAFGGYAGRIPPSVADVSATGAVTEPVPLSTAPADSTLVAVAEDGRAAVAWENTDLFSTDVFLATRAPGGEWTAARRISRGEYDFDLNDLELAPDGDAIVAWTRRRPKRRAQYARIDGDGVRVWSAGANTVRPRVAVSDAFAGVQVTWVRPKGRRQNRRFHVAFARVRGRTIRLQRSSSRPFGAIGAGEHVAVAYQSGDLLRLARFSAGGRVVRDVVARRDLWLTPRVAVEGDRTLVTFNRFVDRGNVREFPMGADARGLEPIGPAADLSRGRGGDEPFPALGGGRAAAVWNAPSPIPGPYGAAVAEPGGAFAPATLGGTNFVASTEPNVALNDAGAGIATYLSQTETEGAIDVLVARLPAPAG